MEPEENQVKIAISELNTNIATVLLSRLMTIVGIPAVAFLIWSMINDIQNIEKLVAQIDKRVLIIELEMGLPRNNNDRYNYLKNMDNTEDG